MVDRVDCHGSTKMHARSGGNRMNGRGFDASDSGTERPGANLLAGAGAAVSPSAIPMRVDCIAPEKHDPMNRRGRLLTGAHDRPTAGLRPARQSGHRCVGRRRDFRCHDQGSPGGITAY
jgi:hypothetical protein